MFKLARSPATTPSPAKLSKRPLGPQEPPPGSRDYAGDKMTALCQLSLSRQLKIWKSAGGSNLEEAHSLNRIRMSLCESEMPLTAFHLDRL